MSEEYDEAVQLFLNELAMELKANRKMSRPEALTNLKLFRHTIGQVATEMYQFGEEDKQHPLDRNLDRMIVACFHMLYAKGYFKSDGIKHKAVGVFERVLKGLNLL